MWPGDFLGTLHLFLQSGVKIIGSVKDSAGGADTGVLFRVSREKVFARYPPMVYCHKSKCHQPEMQDETL